MHLVKHRSTLKHRIHATLMTFGRPCPVTDLFGKEGRERLARLEVPESWRSNVIASLELIDELDRKIADCNRRLQAGHADHPYVGLLETVPGIGKVLAFTIASEIGDISRFPSAKHLTGYSGVCPRVKQSGDSDRRGPPIGFRWDAQIQAWPRFRLLIRCGHLGSVADRLASIAEAEARGRLHATGGVASDRPRNGSAILSPRHPA